jgi:3-deoxy-manno-octulosonate cytidylyltransferase (CMP-KDO synthetase)
MNAVIVIPARYKSTRLPGKPLIDLAGRSMILRTYDQCLKVLPREKIIIATEDKRIADHCEKEGASVIMTSDNCLTGTDRVAEVSEKVDADYYVNVQGDEPLCNPLDIHMMLDSIARFQGKILNGYCALTDAEQYNSLSIPKVVFRPDGRLLYMSRSPIPGNKELRFDKGWRQVCIYGFPKDSLAAFSSRSRKTTLEEIEDIEILRFLEMGYDVQMLEMSSESIAVDRLEDVAKVVARLAMH